MSAILSALLNRLHDTLTRCESCESDRALRTVFVDARLSQWAAALPEAGSKDERIRATIKYLTDKHNARGENGLVLFLRVLCDQIPPTDSHHQELAALADELEQVAPTSDTPQWDAALDRYREWVKRTYGTMRVLGKPEPVSVEGIYTDVYILKKPQAMERYDLTNLPQDPSQLEARTKRVDGLELIQSPDNQHLVILGQPGAGKTTFLKHVALQAAERKLVGVPIFVTLREYANADLDLLDFITEEFALCGVPDAQPLVEQILSIGEAIVLFDGLDEVRTESGQRDKLISALEQFSKHYSTCRTLIACRTAATEYQFREFKYVEFADFTDEQVEAYATNWFNDDLVKSKQFLAELRRDKHLCELAQIPLLLGMLCLAFEELGAFPKRRADLYREALDALLEQWDEARGIERGAMRHAELYHSLSTKRKHQMFAQVAYTTFEQGDILIPQKRLEMLIESYLVTVPNAPERIDIDAKAILKAIEAQHGILVRQAHSIYSFVHLSFHEYLAARHIADRANGRDIDILSHLLIHAYEDRWREVILLTASLLNTTDDFFELFLDHLDALIADDTRLVEFFAWAEHKTAAVQVPNKSAAVRSHYTSLALASASARASILVSTFNRAFPRAHDLDFYDFHISNLARARDLARTRARDLASASASARDLSHVTASAPGADALYQAFGAISIPTASASGEAWQAFSHKLQMLIIEHQDIGHDWDFSEEQVEALDRYFTAAYLLVACLDVANVTDRAAIEDRLLLPPKQE